VTKAQADDLEAVRTIVGALDGFDDRDKERILRWVREKLGLALSPPAPTAASPALPQNPSLVAHPPSNASHVSNIRTFVEKKKPISDTHFAATIAYYYRFEAPEQLRKDSITKEDLQEACRQADRERIRYPAQTLINAHAQGLLDRGERGAYVINTVGENLVAMALPSDGATKPVRRAAPRRSGKKAHKRQAKRKTGRPARE
jgi:hypothetical protein